MVAISGPQLRAARGMLDWTREQLAKEAGISQETVKNIEHGIFRPQESTTEAIIRAFSVRNVMFTEDDGVKLSVQPVKIFTGKQGMIDYLNHVYSVVNSGNIVTRHFNFEDVNVTEYADKFFQEHNKRMLLISKLDAKCLVPYGSQSFPAKYCEYRWLPKEYSSMLPYYVYGDYVLFFMSQQPDFMVVSIHSDSLAKNLRDQFANIWDQAMVPQKKFDLTKK